MNTKNLIAILLFLLPTITQAATLVEDMGPLGDKKKTKCLTLAWFANDMVKRAHDRGVGVFILMDEEYHRHPEYLTALTFMRIKYFPYYDYKSPSYKAREIEATSWLAGYCFANPPDSESWVD